MRRVSVALILVGLSRLTFGQAPLADFALPAQVCIDESFDTENNSSNATQYIWDFCEGDLLTNPALTTIGSAAPALSPEDMDIHNDNGQWIGILTSRGDNSLFRINFGEDMNGPIISTTNLGNINGLLSNPNPIKLVNQSGSWYGLVLNSGNSTLIRLVFGSSLLNTPTAELVLSGIGGNVVNGMDIVLDNGAIVAVVANSSDNRLTLVNFGSDISINPTPANVLVSSPLSGAFGLDDITLQKYQGIWYGFVGSISVRRVFRITFGATLFSNPSAIAPVTNVITTSQLRGIEIARDAGTYVAYLITLSGEIIRLTFGTDLLNNLPGVETLASSPLLTSQSHIELVKSGTDWHLITVNSSTKNVLRGSFASPCIVNIGISTVMSPTGISYGAPGTMNISLTALNPGFDPSYLSKTLVVLGQQAPDISFTFQNNCADNDVIFTSQNVSSDITDYNWDFGDMNSSMDPNPTHQYTSAGEYEVSLQVTATNGCNNLARDTITIFDQPTANFDLLNTGSAPFCTNQEYLFTNTSTFDDGSNPSWQWQVNGMPVSSDQDLTFTIPSAIPQDIKLIASIPGCSDELVQTINTVEEGPLTNFIVTNECEDIAVHFTNTTTGTVTGYTWNFGDGNASTQTNPSNIFEDFGNYDVTMEATNAAGCVNSIVKPITIFSKPQPDFSLDLPPFSCSGSPSQFSDLTPNPTDSNLDSWTWSFGDPINGSSAARNPQYIFANAGSYNVNLAVTTNFGCYAAIEKPVTILQSPSAEFSTSAVCINQPTVFTPSSTTGAVSWQWEIYGVSYSEQNPTHTFNASLSFPAELVVTGDNGCIAIESKLVNVAVAPVIDFASMNNCATQVTTFNDASSIVTDLPQSWLWEFDESGTGSGENTSYTFPTSGTYPARLTVTYNSGCSYSIVKDVSISNPPVATFSATPEFGTPPLAVLLTNNSVSVSSQAWTIDGSVISTNPSTQFIFNELGEYSVDLSVTNASGCSDTATKMISVVVPSIDVELTSITLLPADNGYYNILLVLLNKSNTTINDIETKIDIGGNAQITETITENIPPGAMFSKVLTTGFLLPNNSSAYVCVELIATGDVDESNNRNCEITNETVVLTASPNPASDQLTLDWVASTSGNAEVYIFDSAGHRVFQNNFTNYSAGLNHLTISLTNLNPGMYYLYFMSDNMSRSFPIMINR